MINPLRLALPALLLLTACDPGTTRPQLMPTPESQSVEMRAAIPKAIETLGRALEADAVPIRRLESRDGWLESGWYRLSTGEPAARAEHGEDVVRVRAWAEPSRVKHVLLFVQVEHRPRFDPSLNDNELARTLPADHPLSLTVKSVLDAIGERPGIVEAPAVEPAP